MTFRCGLVIVAIVLGVTSAVSAEPANCRSEDFNVFYDCLRERTIATLGQQRRVVEEAARRVAERKARRPAQQAARSLQVPVHAPSLSTANAATAAELAQAAISTSVSGADAGISLSPLALIGYQESAVQIPITFAALKEGTTRL